jgi:hypothetical protein
MITYEVFNIKEVGLEVILSLYEDANWTNYLNDKSSLVAGLKASLLMVGAFDNNKLICFIMPTTEVMG